MLKEHLQGWGAWRASRRCCNQKPFSLSVLVTFRLNNLKSLCCSEVFFTIKLATALLTFYQSLETTCLYIKEAIVMWGCHLISVPFYGIRIYWGSSWILWLLLFPSLFSWAVTRGSFLHIDFWMWTQPALFFHLSASQYFPWVNFQLPSTVQVDAFAST